MSRAPGELSFFLLSSFFLPSFFLLSSFLLSSFFLLSFVNTTPSLLDPYSFEETGFRYRDWSRGPSFNQSGKECRHSFPVGISGIQDLSLRNWPRLLNMNPRRDSGNARRLELNRGAAGPRKEELERWRNGKRFPRFHVTNNYSIHLIGRNRTIVQRPCLYEQLFLRRAASYRLRTGRRRGASNG
jgi:hypothetical protein